MNNKKAKAIKNSCPCDSEGNVIKNIYKNAKKIYTNKFKAKDSSSLSEFLSVRLSSDRYKKLNK